MDKLSPVEKLDLVLRQLKEKEDQGWIPYDSLFVSINKFKSFRQQVEEGPKVISVNDFNKVIAKLIKDDFIDFRPSGKGDLNEYKITFDGDNLLELEDGYSGRLKKERKNKKIEIGKYLISTFAGGLIGLLGVWLGHRLTEIRESGKSNTNEFQKIQIVHDTVFLNVKKGDTSLVRLVKQPKPKK